MPLPDNQLLVAEVILYGKMDAGGSETVNTVNIFHYRRATTTVPMTKVALDTAFQAAVVVKIGLALNERWNQLFNTVRMVNDALDPIGQFSHAVAGAITGDSMSSLAAQYILLRTGLRGRNYRGAKHFGPLSETDTTGPDGDILNAAAITRFGAIITALITPIVDGTGNTWNLEVLSRTKSRLIRNPTTVVSTQVTSILLNKRVGRMRRREVASVY